MDRLQPAVRQGRAADGVTGDAARVSSDRLDWRGGRERAMAGGEQRWAAWQGVSRGSGASCGRRRGGGEPWLAAQ